jgi:hypothetical protein
MDEYPGLAALDQVGDKGGRQVAPLGKGQLGSTIFSDRFDQAGARGLRHVMKEQRTADPILRRIATGQPAKPPAIGAARQ